MPEDRTPHGGEVMHKPPEREWIPEREPDQPEDEHERGQPRVDQAAPDKSPSGGGKTDFVQTPD